MSEYKDLLSIEYVSVVGLLLCIIAILLRVVYILYNANKEKDEKILNFIDKYYVLATRLNDFLQKF